MAIVFNLDDEQEGRVLRWREHHWKTVHSDFNPHAMTGAIVRFTFVPTSLGPSCNVECVWCPEGHPHRSCNLTRDFDSGEFVIEYDKDWNETNGLQR